MKITKLIINGYGKFLNKQLKFSKGFNLVFGKNEAGKSTIQSFIINTLFGFDNKNKDSEGRLPDIKKYKPWGNTPYEGAIEVLLDNGDKYLVEKQFSTKLTKIYNNYLEDITSKFNYTKKEGVMFGETIFSINKKTFVNTSFIEQANTNLYKNDKKELFNKIINLQESGEESISVSKAIKLLSNAKVEMGHENTKNRFYNITIEKIEKLKIQLQSIMSKRNEIIEKHKKQIQISKEIEEIEEEIKKIEDNLIKQEKNNKIEQLILEKKELIKKQKQYNYYENEDNTINIKLNKLIANIKSKKLLKEIDETDIIDKLNIVTELMGKKNNNSKIKFHISFYIEIILFIISIILSISINQYIYIVSFLLLLLFIIQVLYKSNNKKKATNKNTKKSIINFIETLDYPCTNDLKNMKAILKKIYNAKRNIISIENAIEIEKVRKDKYITLKLNILEQLKYKSIGNLETRINEINNVLEKNNYIESKEKIDYKKILEETKVIKNDKEKNNAHLIGQLKAYWAEDKDIANIVEEITKYEGILEQIKQKQKSLQLAQELIEQAAKEIKLDILPEINNRMSEYLKIITNNKYDKLITGQDTQLNTQYNNFVKNIWEFSAGTIEQMYLSLRLATADILSKNEVLPIILDEVFAFYDKERIESTFALLYEISKEKQVILFTCKEEELLLAKENKDINIILL